jgi:hypothetical protein
MEKNSNFSAARRNGASRATRSDPAAKTHSNGASSNHPAVLQKALQNLPNSRPEAVLRAMRLIASPGYPPPRIQRVLAQHLAVQLTDEIDPLPT